MVNFTQFIGNTITSLGVFPANVTTPFESILNGPAETGVTFVLVELKQYSKYHYLLLNTTFGFTPVFTATGLSSTINWI
jgi:hypothetical protein